MTNARRRTTQLLLVVGLLFTHAAASAQQPAAKDPKAADELAPFQATDKLPLLKTKVLAPTQARDAFEIHEWRGSEFPRDSREGASALPDVDSKDAEAKFRDWIRTHFGELPRGTTLVRAEHERPGTLMLSQSYRGVPIGGHALLERRPDGTLRAHLKLLSCEEEKETAKTIVDSKLAIETWRRALASPQVPDEARKHFEKYAKPKLVYVWSPSHFRDSIGNEDFETNLGRRAPTWNVDGGARMVDGQTGRYWFDD